MDLKLDNFELRRLITDALDGNTDSFGVLVSYYDDKVRPYVERLCNNDYDSNDVLQETYIKAFNKLATYNPAHGLDVWLRTIARNTFLDIKRKQKSTESFLVDDTAKYDIASNTITPEDIIINNERVDKVEVQLSKLAPHYQRIIELRYFELMSYNDIATTLQIPIGTVKTQLFRAKKMLVKIIDLLDK